MNYKLFKAKRQLARDNLFNRSRSGDWFMPIKRRRVITNDPDEEIRSRLRDTQNAGSKHHRKPSMPKMPWNK